MHNSSTYKLKDSSTYKLKDSSTQKLKFLSFILQYHSNFRSVLAKIQVKKQVNSYYFCPATSSNLSVFKKKTCILHHFAFLVWLPTRIFSTPITRIQPLKSHFLRLFCPFQPCVSWLERVLFIHCSVFLCPIVSHLQRIAPHFAAFYLAFCTKMPCIQYQNALHLAPKRTSFCYKQPKIQC